METLEAFKNNSEVFLFAAVFIGGSMFGIFKIAMYVLKMKNGGPSDEEKGVTLADLHGMHGDIKSDIEEHRTEFRVGMGEVNEKIEKVDRTVTELDARTDRLEDTTGNLTRSFQSLDKTVRENEKEFSKLEGKLEGAKLT